MRGVYGLAILSGAQLCTAGRVVMAEPAISVEIVVVADGSEPNGEALTACDPLEPVCLDDESCLALKQESQDTIKYYCVPPGPVVFACVEVGDCPHGTHASPLPPVECVTYNAGQTMEVCVYEETVISSDNNSAIALSYCTDRDASSENKAYSVEQCLTEPGGEPVSDYSRGDCDGDGVVNGIDCSPCDAADRRRRTTDDCGDAPTALTPATGSQDGLDDPFSDLSDPQAAAASEVPRLGVHGGGGCMIANRQSGLPLGWLALAALGVTLLCRLIRRQRLNG